MPSVQVSWPHSPPETSLSIMVVSFPRGRGFRSVRGNWSTPVWWSKILGPSHDDSNLCYHHEVGILGFIENIWTAESWSTLKLLPHDLKAFMISGCHVRLTLMNPRCFISHHLNFFFWTSPNRQHLKNWYNSSFIALGCTETKEWGKKAANAS